MSYQRVLDEAIGEVPPSTVDIDGIMRRQRRWARTRPLLAVAGAVLVVSGIGLVVSGGGPDGSAPAPGASPDLEPIVYFPEHLAGKRVIAEAWGPLSEGRLELTFTMYVRQQDLTFFIRCETDGPDAGYLLDFVVGPGQVAGLDCGEHAISPSGGWAGFPPVGEDFTVALVVQDDGDPDAPPPVGTFGIAVGEPAPEGGR